MDLNHNPLPVRRRAACSPSTPHLLILATPLDCLYGAFNRFVHCGTHHKALYSLLQMAEVVGFEPTNTGVKVQRLDRLATPQYLDLAYLLYHKSFALSIDSVIYFLKMVPMVGLEPTRTFVHPLLRRGRLPVPTHWHIGRVGRTRTYRRSSTLIS